MGKQNGEDLDQDAQERMLKEDSAAKIAIEKDEKATEVRISFASAILILEISHFRGSRGLFHAERMPRVYFCMFFSRNPFKYR